MRRLLALVLAIGAVGAAVVLSGAANPEDQGGATYNVILDNAFGLTEGGDFRLGGVRVGAIQTIGLTQEFPLKAVATVKAERAGLVSLRKDATCDVRQQSLIGEYFIDCQPGTATAKLPNDGIVPVEQTSSTIPIDLMNAILRRPYRERFRLIIAELGTALAGRPEELSNVLRRAHPGLRETSKTLKLLGNQNEIIKEFITDSDTVVERLEARKTEVSRWVTETGRTAEISASRKQDIERNFRKLPPFLERLQTYMVQLGRFTDELTPTLRDLRTAAPDLEEFFAELGPFSEASRPAFRALGPLSDDGRAAIEESKEEVQAIRQFARELPRLTTPARQFLQTLDDRKRSVEADPEAADTAPNDDKTSDADGKGYTGFESFFNYVYYQTLATNGFTDLGHYLRITLIVNNCTPYAVDPDDALIEDCNQFTGPNQPGVTTSDPTE